MTLATHEAPTRETHRDQLLDKLLAAIEPEFATAVGWTLDGGLLVFPQAHPLLGWNQCVIPDCKKSRTSADGVCASCHARWTRLGRPDRAEFLATPKGLERMVGVQPCAVLGCGRPWKTKRTQLCLAHEVQQRNLAIPLTAFLARDDLVAHPSLGPCSAASCLRERAGRGAYCVAHYNRWKRERSTGIDEDRWRATTPAIAEDNLVSLRGLPPRVAAEFVYGLQQRTKAGAKTRFNMVRPVIDAARSAQVSSLTEIESCTLGRSYRGLLNEVRKGVALLDSSPETERRKDRWNLVVFGHSGNLRFTEISQPWLRAAAQAWAFDDLPRRRGNGVAGTVQSKVSAIALLSDSLRLQRDDQGLVPAALSRTDITAFCNRLAFLQEQGTLSAARRFTVAHGVKLLLGRARTLGLTRQGQALHGLPYDFALGPEDLPDPPEDQEAGKDLPPEVLQHLCSHLDLLESTSAREVRVAVELMIDTGRRPEEITELAWDCLDRDEDGKPVLVFDNRKAHRFGRRLPIAEATAALIVKQQMAARERFPNTAQDALKLLPSPVMNPEGRKAITDDWVSDRHRIWADSLPDILVPSVVQQDGKLVTAMMPFDKKRIFCYAYRHSFAQRHADAGVAVEVLKELMDHRLLSTTQCYYRVGEKRRREAVDRVTTMQFDRHGNRIWRRAQALLDSEHARRAIGEVAVPYGLCTEPSNVAADGQDCPLRFRCVGCGHFRTDVSYLPDLEAYLADLLRSRERLLSAVDADDWAQAEAMPSDDEISRVRRLINRVKSSLDELSTEEHTQIRDAVQIVRRARNGVVGLGLPRVRQPLPDLRPDRAQ